VVVICFRSLSNQQSAACHNTCRMMLYCEHSVSHMSHANSSKEILKRTLNFVYSRVKTNNGEGKIIKMGADHLRIGRFAMQSHSEKCMYFILILFVCIFFLFSSFDATILVNKDVYKINWTFNVPSFCNRSPYRIKRFTPKC